MQLSFAGNRDFEAGDIAPEISLWPEFVSEETGARMAAPAYSGTFSGFQKPHVFAEVRGGAGRTRTSNHPIMERAARTNEVSKGDFRLDFLGRKSVHAV